MPKNILITGATDGIGLEAAKMLAQAGHHILLHGRSQSRLDAAQESVGGSTAGYLADLSNWQDIAAMARAVATDCDRLDVLINNAGVLKAENPVTADGLDLRVMVNTLAPYALTRLLLRRMGKDGRIINLSSAAQAPVDLAAMASASGLADMAAYAQSKLAITMWSRDLAQRLPDGPVVIALNPGSLLASKMVREGFGIAGNDIGSGAQVLRRAALDPEFAGTSGQYFDNDAGDFGPPHPDALDPAKVQSVVSQIETLVNKALPTG